MRQMLTLILLALVVGCELAAAGALPKLQQELTPQKGASLTGYSVAINSAGTRVIMSGPAPPGNILTLDNLNGSVSIFDRSGSTWTQTAVLKRNVSGLFGFSVDISADGRTIVVGDPYFQEENAAIFVYENLAGSSWDTGTLIPIYGEPAASLTVTIAADGNTFAGTFAEGFTAVGSGVMVFARMQSAWTLQGTVFNPSNQNIRDHNVLQQGLAISGDGSEIVVGYPGDLDFAGSIGYYKRNSSLMWSMSGPYISINGSELLGGSLSMTRDASYFVSGVFGGAYVFKKSLSGETYDLLQAFSIPSDADIFSPSIVAIQPTNGKQIFIGNAFAFSEAGAVYMYNVQGDSFVPVPGYISSGITNATAFGYALDVSDSGTLVVGAPLAGRDDSGAGFVFVQQNGCRPNNGLNQLQCVQRSLTCANSLKWTGKGCRMKKKPQSDGGCQCRGYCGYKCRGACNSDKECTWKTAQKACYVKATQQRGGPITSC